MWLGGVGGARANARSPRHTDTSTRVNTIRAHARTRHREKTHGAQPHPSERIGYLGRVASGRVRRGGCYTTPRHASTPSTPPHQASTHTQGDHSAHRASRPFPVLCPCAHHSFTHALTACPHDWTSGHQPRTQARSRTRPSLPRDPREGPVEVCHRH